MPLEKLNAFLGDALDELAAQQPLKGREQVIVGIQPGKDGFGPRFVLAGYEGREFLRMNSNSYLALSRNPQVIAAEEAAIRQYGAGPGAVRFISGTYKPHTLLEQRLALFHGRPAAMLFSAAYAAVVGVLASLITSETVVLSDNLNHNSIINGIRLSRPLAKVVYRHGDVDDLQAQLAALATKGRRALVITDGIFSMRGDHAPLAEIMQCCRKWDANYSEGVIVMVDDSHGVGVFGPTGRGTEEETGAHADILVGTLGKAFGVNGGYVAASAEVINYLRETAPLYIYSNPITPPEAAAACAAVDLVDCPDGIKELGHVRRLAERLRDGFAALGYETIPGSHPIVPLLLRDTQKTDAVGRHLFEHQILVTGLNYPVVPKGEEEIRFQVSAELTQRDIDWVLEVLGRFHENAV